MSDPYPEGPVAPSPAEVDVSVVVPVYNAMPYLGTLIRSLVDQDLDRRRYEVLAIDDGSTDDGPAVLDEFAARHPQLTVVHQANSGWPGIPRNRGLDLARGRYVFFADADDEMGPQALRRMVQFADEHGSDVLLPKMVGVGGRWVRRMYEQTQVDADLETAFTTLSPQKLFRRSFLVEEGIRFPEEKVRLEDGMFLARAYLRARRVSLLGGYDFYRLVARDDGQNISSQPLDPAGYTWSVGEVSRLILENDPDPERAGRIVLDLYRRKCLKFYGPVRLLRMPQARRRAFLRAHANHIERFIPRRLRRPWQNPSGPDPVWSGPRTRVGSWPWPAISSSSRSHPRRCRPCVGDDDSVGCGCRSRFTERGGPAGPGRSSCRSSGAAATSSPASGPARGTRSASRTDVRRSPSWTSWSVTGSFAVTRARC